MRVLVDKDKRRAILAEPQALPAKAGIPTRRWRAGRPSSFCTADNPGVLFTTVTTPGFPGIPPFQFFAKVAKRTGNALEIIWPGRLDPTGKPRPQFPPPEDIKKDEEDKGRPDQPCDPKEQRLAKLGRQIIDFLHYYLNLKSRHTDRQFADHHKSKKAGIFVVGRPRSP
jgi:hypothetical protein